MPSRRCAASRAPSPRPPRPACRRFGRRRFRRRRDSPRLAFFVRLRLRDREDDELAVGRERGAVPRACLNSWPLRRLLTTSSPSSLCADVGIREPLPVVRQARALDRLPVVHDVVGERAFGATGRLRRQRPLQREQRGGEREGPCGCAADFSWEPPASRTDWGGRPPFWSRAARRRLPVRISSEQRLQRRRSGWRGWCGRWR